MNLSCIFTGNELLTGSTVNTNISKLGAMLSERGLEISSAYTCRDNARDISRAIGNALEHSDTILICGGLGATSDDLTLDTAARFFGLTLKQVPELEEKVKEFWARRHKGHCPKFVLRQARLPETARAIDNPSGSASGIVFDSRFDNKDCRVYLLPGPPHEFIPMMKNFVLDELEARSGSEKIYTLGFLACGTGEIKLSGIVKNIGIPAELLCAYTASAEGCRFFLSGKNKELVTEYLEKVRVSVGEFALGIGELSLEEKIIAVMRDKRLTLSTAESCTGGMIGSILTSVSGASSVYMGSAVTYSNEMKNRLLGVSNDTLAAYGAVSSETAFEMAQGACQNLATDAAVAVTGIAGPDGGTAEKPVGLVYVGISCKGKTRVVELRLNGDRDSIRKRTCAAALLELYKTVTAE